MPRSYTTRPCSYCGVEFGLPGRNMRPERLYCSRKCRWAQERRPITERFWEKVTKTDSCWVWSGSLNTNGYGQLPRFGPEKDRSVLAHRISFELHFGEIADGLIVLHTCDNPACVRPDHLYAGTHKQNTGDMTARGRGGRRLNPEKVRAIREARASGTSVFTLAREFGVSPTTIGLVVNRHTWKHVP